MAPKKLAEMECSVARTLDVVGERWSLLILRNAFFGVRRFDDWARDLGVARNVLTDRLHKLVEHGVFERHQYEERPPRFEYRLTEKGRDLLPVVLALMAWGDKWTSEGDPPVTITHLPCGQETAAQVACAHCGGELNLRDVRAHPVRVTGARAADGTLVGT